jgi:hypothetical protein
VQIRIKFIFTPREVYMEIIITKLGGHIVSENCSDVITTYRVLENSKEFTITCKSNHFGRSFSLAEKEGTLYIEREKNKVHVQKVALGGGCGLLIDDEPVEGLSPMAIRGIIVAQDDTDVREIKITDNQPGRHLNEPLIFINGNVSETSPFTWKDIGGNE